MINRYHGWLGCILLLISPSLFASQYTGRFTTGGYASQEKFAEKTADGSTRNDLMTTSGRVFLNVYDMGRGKYEWTTDIRDKYDFFEELDKKNLSLNSKNALQVRQLSIKDQNALGKLYWSLGRFPVSQAGAVYTDGIETGYHWNSAFSTGLYGGLNPRRDDYSYLTFQKNARVAGLYFLFDPRRQSWGKYTYMTNGVTVKEYEGTIDRIFWFHNSVFQFSRFSRWINFFNLDVSPSFRIQNLSTSYWQAFNTSLSSNFKIIAYDAIEYRRKQSVREQLSSSPYREGEAGLELKSNPLQTFGFNTSYGQRKTDSKSKIEARLSSNTSQALSKYTAINAALGYRANFDSDDIFGRFGIGFYSKNWELGLTEEVANERYTDGSTLTPIITEMNTAHFFSKSIYGTLSFQYAKDQRVDVFSGFLKISYRFGSENIPEVRDGAPPVGGI